jgi:polygalacturonase
MMPKRNRPSLVLFTVATLACAALTQVCAPALARAATLSVKSFGAKGDGHTNDAAAINAAIAAGAAGDTVEFPAGTYVSTSIHLRSSITLVLDPGATIQAAGGGFDPAEPNPFGQYQDYGHSHFHDALIWGENLHDVAIIGSGTIDGNGNLVRSNSVGAGQADKAISLKLINNLTIAGITIRHGGHFGILANGCTNVTVVGVKILTSTDRDAFNLINSSHVQISDSDIEGSDDAMVLKSDFALGRKIGGSDIHVINSRILSTQNNALQFGSETCGDFSNVSFSGITITAAGKAGIGITSNDGAIIDGVTYDNITMSGTATPIFLKLDNQGRCPGHPPVGRIRNVRISNVTVTHAIDARGLQFTSTISGKPGIPIENVTLQNVKITVPGGHPSSDVGRVPPENDDWTPKSLGVRPSYGWFIRHASNISFQGVETHFDNNDGRPAFRTVDGQGVIINSCVVESGSGSAYDIGFSQSTGSNATGCVNALGQPARVNLSPALVN